MNRNDSRLLSPINVGQHVLRNRVIMGSMHTRLEYTENATAKLAAFYSERARGGAALIITGGISPNWEGRIEQEALTLERPDQLYEHLPIVEAVHAEGAKIILQILHSGAYAKHDDIVGVSSIRAPINRRVPRTLSTAEIEATISDFVRCAQLAAAAGYDGIELMGSEGYFLNQCVTSRTNNRSDEWGGSFENRIACPLEIVRRTRAALGDGPLISYRISALDLVEGGLVADEVETFARMLEAAGIDLLNTGVGWHESPVPTIAYVVPRGAFAFAARRLRDVVSIPVVASNRINTPEIANEILEGGEADMVSMARPLLADPDFVRKVAENRQDEINTCIACNQACLDYIFSDRTASCLVNPRACQETEFPTSAALSPKRIAVVGGGPAGMACAATAAERGHHVVLFEASDELGGQINLARAVPLKTEFEELLRYFRRRLTLSGVDVRLNSKASAEVLLSEEFDHVVVATGIKPRPVDVDGADHPSVVSYVDILSGRVRAGARVAIIGMGGIAFDVADFLTADHITLEKRQFLDHWGVDPSIKEPGGLRSLAPVRPERAVWMFQRGQGRVGERLGLTTGWIHRGELKRRWVQMIGGCRYLKVDSSGFHYETQGEQRLLPVDTIVVCAGQEPDQMLAHDLEGQGLVTHLIGGARYAAELDATRAINEGTRLAYAI